MEIPSTIMQKYLNAKVEMTPTGFVNDKCDVGFDVSPKDKTLNELEKDIKTSGIRIGVVRIGTADTIGTTDARDDRLNVQLQQVGLWDWRITRLYFG